MKTLSKTIVLSLILIISLTHCSVLNTASLAGHYAGGDIESKDFSYDYETDLTSKSELLSACATVGAQLGYTVESQTPEMISWKTGESNRLQEYFGKYSFSSLYVGVMGNEDKTKQTLRIGSYISGNYSEADKAKVDTLITDFETKLRDNLEKSNHGLKRLE